MGTGTATHRVVGSPTIRPPQTPRPINSEPYVRAQGSRTRSRRGARRPARPAPGRDLRRLHLRRRRPRAPDRRAARPGRRADRRRPRPRLGGALAGIRRRGAQPCPFPARRLRGGPRGTAGRGCPARRHRLRPRHVLDAGRRLGARLLLLLRRAPRHADGPDPEPLGRDRGQRLAPGPPGSRDPRARRGAPCRLHRPRDRQAPPDRDDLAAGHRDQGRDPALRALRARASGEAHLPGDPDRGQRRARVARSRAADRMGAPEGRRASGRDLLPLARGPARQALPRRPGPWLRLPARASGLRLRARARGRSAHQARCLAGDRGARAEPARGLRAPAGGAQDPRGGGGPDGSRNGTHRSRARGRAPRRKPAESPLAYLKRGE